jgi:probable F420-dependent oxidoreductase
VKFGMVHSAQDPPNAEHIDSRYQEVLAEAEAAEAAGFDSFLITEHHQVPDGYCPAPLVLSTAVAARTSRIRVGSAIIILPLYHPLRVAEETAVLDAISQGRLILGVGAGYVAPEFDAYGIPMEQRSSRMEEGIEIIKRAWTENGFSYSGRRFSIENVTISPKPVQKPRPPIWAAAWSESGFSRAARLADAWCVDLINSYSTVSTWADRYRELCTQAGTKPYIAALREAWVGPTTEQAVQDYGQHLMSSHRYYYSVGGYNPAVEPWMASVQSPDSDVTLDLLKKDRFIMGSPDECVDQIKRFNEMAGVDYLILRFRHPSGPEHAKVLEAIKLFGSEVIPRFS